MHTGRRARSELREVVAFEKVEHFDQRDAARAGRRHRDDIVAAVCALHRRASDRFVVFEVLARDQPAVGQHFLFERHRRFAFVKTHRTLGGDAFQRARKIRLLQRVARLVRHSVLRELGNRRGILLHALQHRAQ